MESGECNAALRVYFLENFTVRSKYYLRYKITMPGEKAEDEIGLTISSEKSSRLLLLKKLNGKAFPECRRDLLTYEMTVQVYMHSESYANDNHALDLSNDLGSFLKSETLSDVAFIVKNTRFPAHKMCLAARSTVFAALFTNGEVEKSNNVIHVDNCEPSLIEEMLRYVYTDAVDNLEDIAIDLLPVADKYGLGKLKDKCTDCLMIGINSENVTSRLLLAKKYRIPELSKEIYRFAKKNVQELLHNPEFESLFDSRGDIIEDMFRYVCRHDS